MAIFVKIYGTVKKIFELNLETEWHNSKHVCCGNNDVR